MRRYLALCEEWRKRPPASWLKAAELQYKPPHRASPAADAPDTNLLKLTPTGPRSPEAEARRLAIIAAAKERGEPTVDDGPHDDVGLAAALKQHGGVWRG